MPGRDMSDRVLPMRANILDRLGKRREHAVELKAALRRRAAHQLQNSILDATAHDRDAAINDVRQGLGVHAGFRLRRLRRGRLVGLGAGNRLLHVLNEHGLAGFGALQDFGAHRLGRARRRQQIERGDRHIELTEIGKLFRFDHLVCAHEVARGSVAPTELQFDPIHRSRWPKILSPTRSSSCRSRSCSCVCRFLNPDGAPKFLKAADWHACMFSANDCRCCIGTAGPALVRRRHAPRFTEARL